MAHACAAVYFLNLRGDVLIERRYRDDVERDMVDNFRTRVLTARDLGLGATTTAAGGGGGGAGGSSSALAAAPVRTLGSVTFMYLRHGDVYLLMLTKNNANAMMAFKFMTSLVDLLRSYFEGALTEASVKRNFVLIYELLDEAMDFGFPQLTEPAALKSFILQRGVRDGAAGALLGGLGGGKGDARDAAAAAAQAKSATLTVTGAVSWRRQGLHYKRNEVFLDVVEEVNLLMSAAGDVLRNDVAGRVVMKCLLSGMPELRMGLSDVVEDATFHQCVSLGAYEAQRVITFVPPDGEFELMRYRTSRGVSSPFKVIPVVKELGRTRLEATVAVRSLFGPKLFALTCVVLVPVPDTTSRVAVTVSAGKAKYDPARKAIVWKIKRFAGAAEHSLRADVAMVATTKERARPWARPPIALSFSVPMFSASGLRVAYLKVLERRGGAAGIGAGAGAGGAGMVAGVPLPGAPGSAAAAAAAAADAGGYAVEKWVRKLCKSGDFQVRI